MEKRTFSTAKKPPRSNSRSGVGNAPIRSKKGGPARTAGSGAKRPNNTTSRKRSAGTRSAKPGTQAARPPANDNKKVLLICGAVGALVMVILIVAASGGGQQQRQPVRTASPSGTNGKSTHERMMNQRYGGSMDGKTVQEWMKENGDTDFAQQRRDARKNRKR